MITGTGKQIAKAPSAANREIPACLEQLDVALGNLQAVFEALAARLAPVTATGTQPSKDNKCPNPMTTSIGGQLQRYKIRIDEIAEAVTVLENELAL